MKSKLAWKKRERPEQYRTGYDYGSEWIKEFGNLHPVPFPKDWPEDYRDGFRDGFNNSLELLRIEG